MGTPRCPKPMTGPTGRTEVKMHPSKARLAKLDEFTKSLSSHEKLNFESVLIGALSVVCTDEQWDEALGTASRVGKPLEKHG